MPKKTGFKLTGKPMFLKPSRFEEKWGEPAWKIAERENVSITSIHMRVHKFGNPWQRKAKPTPWEDKYGKTLKEICTELRIHPVALGLRERLHGDVYIEDQLSMTNHRDVKRKGTEHTKHWSELPHYNGKFWLMEEHPDYAKERAKADKYDVAKNIALAEKKIQTQKINRTKK